MRSAHRVNVVALALVVAAGCGDPAPRGGGAPTGGVAQEAPGAARSGGTPEDRLAAAQRLLEIDRRPEDAAAAFRAVADDGGTPAGLRARARLGEARAERLLGRTDSAARLLREVVEQSAEFPAVRDDAQAELTSLGGARTRFTLDQIDLADGQYLDLDTGGAFAGATTAQGGHAEIARRGDDLVWLVPHEEAPGAGGAVPWIADAPWWSTTTDAGRAAWVQRLPGLRPGAVRYLVRVAGTASILPAPGDAYCVGKDGAIDVHFVADARYARWRIERRVGVDGAYEPRGEVTSPVFADADVQAGVRYGYRITGRTADGDEGFPAFVQGTTASRGVVTGTYEFTAAKQGFDFLTRQRAGDGGDLVFANSYGGGEAVAFLDGAGRVVPAAGMGEPPRTPWASPAAGGRQQVEAGQWIVVPVRGGGVARCRVSAPGGAWRAGIDYEVDPDHDAFRPGPVLEAVDAGSRVDVRVVSAPVGTTVRTVLVRDVLADGPPVELTVTDGRALDPDGSLGGIREYTAVAEDAYGRATVRASARVDRRTSGPSEGTFRFHYRQGWSFDRGAVCDPESADVVFSTCAGGISSVTLTAPGGITNLERVVGGDRGSPSAGRLVGAVLSADPDALRLSGSAQGDDRTPESDVFVLRTRHGGWARCAIVERGEHGGWQEKPVTVQFTFNPREPSFAKAGDDAVDVGGLRLAPEAVPARVRARMQPKTAHAVVVDAGEPPQIDGVSAGTLPATAACQEVLLSLAHARDRDMATYSFARARRVAAVPVAERGAPDLLYGSEGDLLVVRPDADDGSTIEDLGVAATWDAVAAVTIGPACPLPSAVASSGHAYLVLLADERGGAPVLLRVTALAAGDRVAFEWARVVDGALRTSRGFTPDGDLAGRLERALSAAAERRCGGRSIAAGPRSVQAQATLDRLTTKKARVGIGPMPFAGSTRAIAKLEIDPAAQARVDAANVCFTSQQVVSFAAVLDSLTRQAGVCWTVDERGAVRIVPRPEVR